MTVYNVEARPERALAVQYTGGNAEEVVGVSGGTVSQDESGNVIYTTPFSGETIPVEPTDWIVPSHNGVLSDADFRYMYKIATP